MTKPERSTVLVTGASSGIGLAVTQRLLAEGYEVVGMARRVHERLADHACFIPLVGDLRDYQHTHKQLKKFLATSPELDAVVFCAGEGYFGKLEQLNFEKIQALIELNLLSQIFLAKMLVPYMKRAARGRLLFIGSEAALQGTKNATAYCASKFGLRGFVQALSSECRPAGVNVSLINPGMVDTSFFDELHFEPGADASNRITPETVAQVVYDVLQVDENTVIEELNLSPRNKVVSFK